MKIWDKIKEFFAWRNVSAFLKELFRGALVILFDELKSLAIDVAKQVAEQGLPDNEAQRKAFDEGILAKAKSHGYVLRDSELNLLREFAVAYIKNIANK